VIDLLLAREWGIPPWLLKDAPQAWITRAIALRNAEAGEAARQYSGGGKWADSLI